MELSPVVVGVRFVVGIEFSTKAPPAKAESVSTTNDINPAMAPLTAILFDDCMMQSYSQVSTGG